MNKAQKIVFAIYLTICMIISIAVGLYEPKPVENKIPKIIIYER